jgi:hypothetical protein
MESWSIGAASTCVLINVPLSGSLVNSHFHPLGCRHDIVRVLQKS